MIELIGTDEPYGMLELHDIQKEKARAYECIACGTTFKEEDGEHKNGYLVCPSCWCDDLRENKQEEK